VTWVADESLFGNVLNKVILANTQKAPVKSRKVIEVGLTNLLTKSDKILEPSSTQLWYATDT